MANCFLVNGKQKTVFGIEDALDLVREYVSDEVAQYIKNEITTSDSYKREINDLFQDIKSIEDQLCDCISYYESIV